MNKGVSISVKCSYQTKSLFFNLFENDLRFIKMKSFGVQSNPSWFFKFCVNYTLKNLKNAEEVKEYSYESHYVDFLDDNLNSVLDNVGNN